MDSVDLVDLDFFGAIVEGGAGVVRGRRASVCEGVGVDWRMGGLVAYLASDVLVISLPPFPAVSPFPDSLSASRHRPTVLPVPHGGDPGSTLLRNRAGSVLSCLALADSQLVTRLVPHITELSSLPLVLHLAVRDDLSDVLILRPSIPFVLHSSTAQQAHDNALLASRLARTEKKAVLHIFHVGESTDSVQEVEEGKVQPFLLQEVPRSPPRSLINGHPNGVNGHGLNGANGHSDDVLESSDSITNELYKAYEAATWSTVALTRRPVRPIAPHSSSATSPHTILLTFGRPPAFSDPLEGVSVLAVSLFSPLPPAKILRAIPPSATRVIVLEQVQKWPVKFTPFFLEVASAVQSADAETKPTVHPSVLGLPDTIKSVDVLKLVQQASSGVSPLHLGSFEDDSQTPALPEVPHVPKHEQSYTKILARLFDGRLEIENSPFLVAAQGSAATTPEFALGRVRGELEERAALVRAVQALLDHGDVTAELHALLTRWLLARDDPVKSRALGAEIVPALEDANVEDPAVARILMLRHHLPARSRWIIGSDAWAYDLGASGLHHAIASGLDVNVLVVDSTPYSARARADPARRKQDVGLYAMNHGDVYVASVAVYSSYAQVLQALVEADRFKGPSVVLAYLPYAREDAPALEVLKETKMAVDAGYWPLYRWDPSKEGEEVFKLDSDAVKNDLQAFLDRQNHISQLVRSRPELASELVGSLGESVKEARRRKAQKAYEDLLGSIDAPPLLVLYASDGGKAEKVAKRLAGRGKARGLSVDVKTMDSVTLEDLAKEEGVVAFVTSVAGQGEFPQNGRTFAKAVHAAATRAEKPLRGLKFSVFGMGDSHYWPRPEDAHYYNKAGKDLDARLEQLGAERVVQLGLGDDQDADGPETGYKVWEPLLWKALGVDAVEVSEAEPEPITNEHIKVASNYLRGTIAEGLEDNTTGALSPADTQLTKFHGIYQQDDRDIRDERQAQGVEPAYQFMIRVRMPGGVCRPDQWLRMDQIADEHGNGTFKITTRQTFQFHGVIKRHLKPAIQDINRSLLDTLAACGDVNRNVLCSAIPSLSKLHAEIYEFAKGVSEHLLPRTTAYHEIWLDKKLVAGDSLKDVEPLYGEFYLPRKFKVAVAVPPTNDVDIFANDVGFIAIVEKGHLVGFNVTAGGGMGVTHGNKKTYPRTADVLGFCTVEQGKAVAEKIMLVQRDNGNRADRKNARLKYTIDRMGLETFKSEVEKLLGWKLEPARPYSFDRNIDDFGWATGEDGKHHFTMFIENGRIQDEPGRDFKTGLREIAKIHKGTFRLTANQHVVISDIPSSELAKIKELLAQYKMDNLSQTGLRLSSSACVAFPTCGLAMAESERYLPVLIDKVEKICEENGLRNDSIVMRMTGCPNGCARPYLAEIAFVGKAPGTYLMLLGGGYYGQRLNKIYRESVTEPEILAILKPMIKHYALERLEGERFGDFVIRAGYIAPTTSGKEWYDRMGGEGEHREVSA
ncbi:sulphite reductase hemo protein beta subunit [Gloeophyllum trabeum ATCC 11539]|uniref:assimilatory sulfite reductase (NADPH) n=1 Tax=Gloeophyllum trabeum (strain ATCC 11539 / FP-39264 / Madison 617) TaxID=670483 RepID=S7QA35_GLOTA|nr:sulphite reductase hemo protein beta subunit [Gloeophyllum trabeum ATCC 11539]EPQ56382.1 sulphite reductase hemo protein beta subunit [Gloeophyllum trabeum ATCC 11539]